MKYSTAAFLFLVMFCFYHTAFSNDRNELAKIFRKSVDYAPKDTYEDYLSSRSTEPLFLSERRVFYPAPNTRKSSSISKIFVITESVLYAQVESYVLRYINDIQNVYGCTIVSQQVSSSATAENLKNLIISEYEEGILSGTVLIGDLPAAWFEIQNDFDYYGYAEFPCDLFLMDLNGTWTDTNGNGKYNSHTGNVSPEIFVGRISTANMGNFMQEVQGMKDYLDKNHDFWTGTTSLNLQKGLTYTDYDWQTYSYFLHDLQYLYGSNYQALTPNNLPAFGKTDYINRLNNEVYEFVQLSCHSSWTLHRMYGSNPNTYEQIYNDEIYNIPPKAIAYNLFCCSGVRWTNTGSDGFLGGAYVYHSGSKTLASVGSTKTGSMLGFSYFYSHLFNEKAIGMALKNWWIDYVGPTHDFDELCWFYGMSIIGDPLTNPLYLAPETPLPPEYVIVSFSDGNINLTWDKVWDCSFYAIYSSDNPYSAFPDDWIIEDDNVTTESWTDTNVSSSKKFYIVTAVRAKAMH